MHGIRYGLALLGIGALLATGCGSAGSSATSAAAGTVTAKEQSQGNEHALGVAAGKAAGAPVAMPKEKAGILLVIGGVESASRASQAMQDAVKALGWTPVVCDGQGDPTKMATCMSNLLNQNVDVIFNLAVDPSIISAQLKEAQRRNVPVVQFGSITSPSPLFTASYDTLETDGAKIADAYLIKRLEATPGPKQIAVENYAALFGAARTAQLKKDLASHPDIKITDTGQIDGTDPDGSTAKLVQSQLIKNPKLSAIYVTFDSPTGAAARVVAARYPGKAFPDRPLVIGFNALQSTLQQVRSRQIDALADVPFVPQAWIAADQAAGFFARHTPMAKSNPSYPIKTVQPILVTKINAPAAGQYPNSSDYPTFFRAKWATEYTGL
jgi:ABC-type sugar transport system substrate-binding protein